jgi:hypothetical protein
MNQLPDEILEVILDYISMDERLEKRLVCKRFRDIVPSIPFKPYKKCILELSALLVLPDLIYRNIKSCLQTLLMEVIDPEERWICKVNFIIYNDRRTQEGPLFTMVRREIVCDKDKKFEQYDDLDEYNYYDGIMKLLCGIYNILSISEEYQSQIYHRRDNILDWKPKTKEFLNSPFENSILIMERYKTILDTKDYHQIQEMIYKNINHILDLNIPESKKNEYLNYIFSKIFDNQVLNN